MEKSEIIAELKCHQNEINKLLICADELKIKVTVSQSWDPMANMNVVPKPLNPLIQFKISETIEY